MSNGLVASKWFSLLGAALVCVACNAPTHGTGAAPEDYGAYDPRSGGRDGGSCGTPSEGCACEQAGQSLDCGQVHRRSGDYVSCSMGKRTCTAGYWGACIGDRVTPMRIRSPQPGTLKPADLGNSAACTGNVCDPYCLNFVDDATNLDAGDDSGLVVDGGLLLIQREAGTRPTTCTGIAVVPTPQTITVTSVSPFVTTPPSLQFNAQLTPLSCASVPSVPAAWSLSQNSIAAISAGGVFSVYSAVATTVGVTGYSGSWTASGAAQILVNVAIHDPAVDPYVASFAGTGFGTDPMTVLYPYAGTLFARGLTAPVIQWDNGGQVADAVKISLRYPATGPTTFSWTNTIAEPTTPQALIPQSVWLAFDQTASNAQATIAIQRLVGGVLLTEQTRTIKFSSAPLRGTIYYTEYGRLASSPAPSPAIGGSCSLPGNGATVRALDVSTVSAPVNPFQTVAPGGCPVCHSVSANGHVFITSNRSWGSGGGVSRINADKSFTLIADSPQPSHTGQDSRGFAWGAVTPDGTYVLQGANIWGNTSQTVPFSGRYSGGTGDGLTGTYYNGQFAGSAILSRTDLQVGYDWGGGSPDPLVPVDTFSVRWTGKVQPYATETWTFQTDTDDGVRLWVNGTLLVDHWMDQAPTTYTGSIALNKGQKYDITMEYYENAGGARAMLWWSSPSTTLALIPQTQLYSH